MSLLVQSTFSFSNWLYLYFVLIFASNELTVNGHFHCHVEQALAESFFEKIHIMHVILNQVLNTEQLEA